LLSGTQLALDFVKLRCNCRSHSILRLELLDLLVQLVRVAQAVQCRPTGLVVKFTLRKTDDCLLQVF